MSGAADKILEYMTQLNLSAAELRLQPVEAYLNAPGVYASANDAPGRAGGRGRGRAPLTPEQQAAAAAAAEELRKWRLALSMDRIGDFRRIRERRRPDPDSQGR